LFLIILAAREGGKEGGKEGRHVPAEPLPQDERKHRDNEGGREGGREERQGTYLQSCSHRMGGSMGTTF
jgi:hypothetical protein